MNVQRLACAAVPIALAVILAAAPAWAQATASISGTVRDQSGAVLPGATITATQTDTGLVRTTTSNDTGSFVLPNLPLGPYRVEASLDGFRTFAQTGIVLQVNSSAVINPVLALGELAESVQVTAAAQAVDTRTSGVGTVVESERIVELPLNARQVTQLITLSGLAVQTGTSPGFSMNTGALISVAGGSNIGVSYALDGAPHLNNFDGTGLHLPFPDALQEFRLTTGSQEASGTIRSGASVSAVTKSGTNTFHGSAFEFLRDSRFNEPDFLSGRKDGLKRNQFGGTFGGPLLRDRVFFFAGLQTTTTRNNPLDQQAFVPTAAMMAGDFTAFASPACNGGRQVTLGAPFVNNRIDPRLMSPAALNISGRLPTPIDPCGKVFWGSPIHQNETQIPARVDFQINDRHSIVGRYMLTTDDVAIPFDRANNNLLVTATGGSDDRAHNLAVGHTWVISPTMVNSFRVLVNDIYADKRGPSYFSPQDVGINAYTSVPGFTAVIINNAFSVGGGSFVMNRFVDIQNAGISNDFTVVKGSHQLGFGGHFLRSRSESVANSFAVGRYTFTGQFTGNAMADFMLGRIGFHRQAGQNGVEVEQPIAGLYAQDSWKLNRVTLNAGVVWNPSLPLDFFTDQGYTFSREAFLQGTRSTVMRNAPPGFSYVGDPGFEGESGVKPRYAMFDPRIGFAWDVTGDGRTAVRAGAGIGHDYINHSVHLNTASVSPFRLTVNLPPGSTLDNPWANYPGGNPFPYTYDPSNPAFPPYGAYLPLPPDLDPATQYSWDIGVQRQVTTNWFASATYVGSKVVNQFVAEEQNPGLNLGTGPCTLWDANTRSERFYPVCTVATNLDQRRALNLADRSVALGYVTQYTDHGYQQYNGVLLNSRLNLGDYLNLNANYTLSKCEGTPNVNGAVLNVGANYIHQAYQNNGPAGIALDEGPCVADRRHLFNLTSVFRTPQIDGVLGALVSNWTASSVLQVRSGAPINVIAGGDPALNGFTDNAPTQRPNVVPGIDPYGDRDALVGYFNIAAFSRPANGTLGDAPYNMLRGPGFWQWDQSFVRGFEVGTGRRIELRAEAINLTNHFNRGNPSAVLGNPATFGRITTSGGTPRIWQFAIKYVF
jgi:hypothetical protein